ncbi:MAG: sugar phosphate isomerase/epimerase [Oscillospiraceae bacterium]|nr:sugar phosphate isomerase/epimerase [Oscillospiraceae bacterium]
MDIAVASVCYRNAFEDEIEAMLADSAEAGFRLVELHGPRIWDPEALKSFDAPAMRARLDALGLRCVGLYPPGFGGRDAEDVERRAKSMALAVSHAKILGCGYVNCSGAERRSEGVDASLDRVALMLERTLELVGDSDVRFGLENHRHNVLEGIGDYRRVLGRVRDARVGVTVDTGHFLAAGVDSLDVIREFGDRVYGVHIKDHLDGEPVWIGRGEVAFAQVISTLRGIGYGGALTIELEHGKGADARRGVRESMAYLSGVLGVRVGT